MRKATTGAMPQCPHCEYYVLEDLELDMHLTIYHPYTVEASLAATRVVEAAKMGKRGGQPGEQHREYALESVGTMPMVHVKELEEIMRPVVSPKRSEVSTVLAKADQAVRMNHSAKFAEVHQYRQAQSEVRKGIMKQIDEIEREREFLLSLQATNTRRAQAQEIEKALNTRHAIEAQHALIASRHKRERAQAEIRDKIAFDLEPTIRSLFSQARGSPPRARAALERLSPVRHRRESTLPPSPRMFEPALPRRSTSPPPQLLGMNPHPHPRPRIGII